MGYHRESVGKTPRRRSKASRPASTTTRGGVVVGAAVLILLFATAVRAIGLGTDLWLDELGSRRVATGMKSVLDTFTLHHEINHHLTTAWMYLIGREGTAFQYRLPSFVCGVAAVAVAGLIGRRRSGATGLIAMILTAASYQLVVFSSEARGYSMAVLCTLLSFLWLERHLDRPQWSSGAAYAIAASIGLFTQPVVSTVLAAACVWSAWRWFRSEARSASSAIRILGPQVIPLVAFAVLYFADLRHVIPGGGTATTSYFDVFAQSVAWTLGAPDTAAMRLVGCAVGIALIGAGFVRLRQTPGDAWVFFAGAVIVFPVLLIILRGSALIYTRHFLLGSVLSLLLVAFLLGSLWSRGRGGKVAVSAALVLYAAANAVHLQSLAEHGRGRYQDAIRFMAEQTPGRPLTIGGDQDFRIVTELDYYMPRFLGDQGQYVRDGHWPPGGPMWVIANADHYEPPVLPHNIYQDAAGNEYMYVRTFPTAPLSGLHWFLFRNRTAR